MKDIKDFQARYDRWKNGEQFIIKTPWLNTI